MVVLKIIIIVLVIAAFGTVGVGAMMPEINWFNFQGVEVLEGKAEIILSGGTFVCECVPMPDPNNPDTNGDGQPDCGLETLPNGAPNLNCEARLCKSDMTMLPNDFCSVCVSPGGSGLSCITSPNTAERYIGSAEICMIDTTCP